MTTAHTATPYYVGAQNDALYIVAGKRPAANNDYPVHEADRTVVAKVYDEKSAEFIVRSCNAHDELVNIIQTILDNSSNEFWVAGARDALAKAGV